MDSDQAEMEAMNRWTLAAYLYVAALAATLVVFVEGCSGQRSDASVAAGPPPTPVRVEAVRLERVAPSLVVPGVVEAESRIELAFRVGGFIARFAVEEGERVEAGDVIAELDLADLERASAEAPVVTLASLTTMGGLSPLAV